MDSEYYTHSFGKTYAGLVVVIGLLCALFGTAFAAQSGWEEIVRGAEKEGEVTVYATSSVGDLQVIWDAFKKKFPKIKLNAVGISTTSEIVTKIMSWRSQNMTED